VSMTVVMMVIGFYFGTQKQKADEETEKQKADGEN
jgi:hypothetical protein